ncbi:YigZ family protein [Acetivibrio cellulolyticus]|uniref:YigZ family protein n=1 Tax=Acetivibrio cellulolyticus TaxID=35830 RepID=UPI0001E2D92A|nr:YigZ family protein [Acetivibrio cellulolyticus]
MDKEYKTVFNSAVCEIEEKKSRFIASVKPVSNEEEALSFINGLKSKYWDATHNVYAYSIGGNNIIQRFSDAGEPSGTAGLPMLEVIKRMEVQNLAVVVTRYFGGTLLGAAGLIRAYGKSAALGVEAAGVVVKKLCREMSVIVEYTLFGKIQSLLISEGYTIKDIVYEQDVELIVFVFVDEVDKFINIMIEATNARAIIEPGDDTYITLDLQGKLIL